MCYRANFSAIGKQHIFTPSMTTYQQRILLSYILGSPRVEAESDSSHVVDFCTSQLKWWDVAAAIFAECVDVATTIGNVNFKPCFRSSNQVAHVLASFHYCNKVSLSRTDEPPGYLVSKLLDDVTSVLFQ